MRHIHLRFSYAAVSPAAVGTVLLGCAALSGCGVPSVHPLYREIDLVEAPGIVGCWVPAGDNEDKEKYKFFRKPNEKAYTMVYTDGKTPARFDVHLVRLGKDLFMDTVPGDNGADPEGSSFNNPLMCSHVVGVHNIWRIGLEGDSLELAGLDSKRLEEALDQGKLTVRHERQEQDGDSDPLIILTASTDELQAFVQKHEDLVFSEDPGVLHREPPPAKPDALRVPAARHPALPVRASGTQPATSITNRRNVRGRVTQVDGTPLAGATVDCTSFESNPVVLGSVKTDADGRYLVDSMSKYAHIEVVARLRGFEPGFVDLPEEGGPEVDFKLNPGHWLEGRTIDEAGKPVAGVSLRLNGEHEGHRFRNTTSDKLGRFRLQDLPAGSTSIEVDHPNYGAIRRMAVVADGRKDHVIVLKAARYVSGIVLDAKTGKPVKQFVVSTFTTADGASEAFKSSDGRFRHRARPMSPTSWFHGWDTDNVTELTIEIEAPGYLPKKIEKAPVGPISAKAYFTVRLQPVNR
jgi:hypothetical protein